MSHPLYPEERQEQTIDPVKEIGRVPVADLSDRVHLARATIRADLDTLARENLIVCTHGGAAMIQEVGVVFFASPEQVDCGIIDSEAPRDIVSAL